MKLLFDQNISHRILALVLNDYPDSASVKSLGMINAMDREIWEFARLNGFVIVTQDSDFNDLLALFGVPPKVIWIRTGNLSTEKLFTILHERKGEILAFLENQSLGCLEIFLLNKGTAR
ncbi:MAG: DUF5615 family PIN-like protein [Flavobacteriales bacterium]|jgi:predicted nuclease of predicted toxin-antitoxin system